MTARLIAPIMTGLRSRNGMLIRGRTSLLAAVLVL